MTTQHCNRQRPRRQFAPAFSTLLVVTIAACASAGPFIPDTTDKIPPPSAREGSDANDVFMRPPWELWRVPNGTARHHGGALVLLRNEAESFKVTDVSVYAANGSDVRLDYVSVDLGSGSQLQETISVFVYRAPADLDGEWKSVAERMKQKWPGATPAEPFPVPERHPVDTKQMAMLAPPQSQGSTQATFVQTSLYHQGEWAVRYEIACPATDVDVARKRTRAFLRSLREAG
jgi:hypothetical protein